MARVNSKVSNTALRDKFNNYDTKRSGDIFFDDFCSMLQVCFRDWHTLEIIIWILNNFFVLQNNQAKNISKYDAWIFCALEYKQRQFYASNFFLKFLHIICLILWRKYLVQCRFQKWYITGNGIFSEYVWHKFLQVF